MAGSKTIAERQADREGTVAAKKSGTGTKPAKVKVREQPGGAVNKSWGKDGENRPQPVAISDRDPRVLRRQFKRRASKVLFFILGSMPTKEDYEAAQAIGPGCVFRNAKKLVFGAPLENCDAVAGAVPDDYAATFPSATSDHMVDETDTGLADGVVRPSRSHPQASGNNPDDVRPGTVARFDPQTGLPIGHASGTGAEMSGGINPRPTTETEAPAEPGTNEQAAAWKSNKVDGATE